MKRTMLLGICGLAALLMALPARAAEPVGGRYVHVMLPGDGRYLSLAEVQVFSGGKNVALKQPTVQTTTGFGGAAAKAVDGNTNGSYSKGSVTHTAEQREPAWEVDLGKVVVIEQIVVWNRDGVPSRAKDIRVSILDARRKVVWGAAIANPSRGATALPISTLLPCSWIGKPIAKIKPVKVSAPRRVAKGKRRADATRRKSAGGSQHAGAAITVESLRRAVKDLSTHFPDKYTKGADFLRRLDELAKAPDAEKLSALAREALLANPLLDFDKLLLVKRSTRNLGLPANWQSNSSLRKNGYDNEIAVLSPVSPDGKLTTFHKPAGGLFVGDVDLHFNGDRMLFSMPGKNGRWQVFEIRTNGTGLRQVTPGDQKDVDSYDACYLPDGKIVFNCTACFIGVPCVYGSSHVTNLYVMDNSGKNIRQLTFDQEHNWCPEVTNDGRVMYLRWEYADLPHSQSRMLFSMNPDGTNQMELYGSNSYWPNSTFYARPVPDHPTKVVGVISGHHGVRRMGELIVFDPARGRHEATGVVQRIPGHGKKVEPAISDRLVNASWPKFLHPWPLSQKYFLAAAQLTARSQWGLYLVDVFDNMLLLKAMPGYALLEPIPLRRRTRPPVAVDRVATKQSDAIVYITDIYQGDGLKGVPRGTVKKLRLFTYHFSYQGMGGLMGIIGNDGPWDIKRVLGTVPVDPDGSVMFRVPANTPIAVHPLDAEGKSLQRMRSWFTAMPGEVLSCVGCHERQNQVTPNLRTTASARPASKIEPWYGPVRGFSFKREVHPVLEKYCVGCHNGTARPGGKTIPDFRITTKIKNYAMVTAGNSAKRGGKFTVAYDTMHRLVRRPGIESDLHLLEPLEYHADTTQLVQMLDKGHHGVRLDAEAWDRIITWIDLNTPFHGTWHEELKDPGGQRTRRRELRKLYAGVDEDPEAVVETKRPPIKPVPPKTPAPPARTLACPNWPFDAAEAKRRQAAAGPAATRAVDLGDGMKLELVLVPAGEFVMGDADGRADEHPLTRVRIDKPFWMGKYEISNEQYARFDAYHDSRVESKNGYQFGVHGYPMNTPPQPVVRITWKRAMAFCQWLSQKTGPGAPGFSLPTEAQWEYACRAGASTAFWFGPADADYSKSANLADQKLREFATNPYTVFSVYKNATRYDDWIPKDMRYNDGSLLTADIHGYLPNPWGLHNMHGNAAEWTRTTYRPYPHTSKDGRDAADTEGRKVVRGGSWRDRPQRCRSAFRLSFQPWQGVYNVSFRVVCEGAPPPRVAAKPKGNP